MKILVLNGSPKVKSDTFRLTDAFLKGLDKNGEHEVHIVHVREKKISPCRGCFGCWQRGDGHCVIADDQNAILDLYREADVIIWSFPLSCYSALCKRRKSAKIVKLNVPRSSWKQTRNTSNSMRLFTGMDASLTTQYAAVYTDAFALSLFQHRES